MDVTRQITRNKLLNFLMDKTEECMNQISGLLQDKHRETNGKAHKDATSSYCISAQVKEDVVRQPSLLSGEGLSDWRIAVACFLIQ